MSLAPGTSCPGKLVVTCQFTLVYSQAWAKLFVFLFEYTLKVFVFEYFCKKCKVFIFVFEYISKVFVFMNTLMNVFNIFHFLLIFFHPVLTSFSYK